MKTVSCTNVPRQTGSITDSAVKRILHLINSICGIIWLWWSTYNFLRI